MIQSFLVLVPMYVLTAGASAQDPGVVRDKTFWYEGTYKVMSPDGKTPYGRVKKVLAKRLVQPGRNQIIEIVDHPTRHFEVTLKRVVGTTRFEAVDKDKSWKGTVVYSGKEWAWEKWTYDIRMTNGTGTLKGTGVQKDGTITTTKTYYDSSGKAQAKIFETVKAIPEKEYERKVKELRKK